MGAVFEVPASLVEVLGAGAVPLGGGGAVGVDPFGALKEVGGVVTERRFGSIATNGLADADEFAVSLFIGEDPVLAERRRSAM